MATFEEKKALHDKGYTYREIAKELSISCQAVSQALCGYYPARFQFFTETRCIYKGLREWLNTNRVSINELIRRIGLKPLSASVNRYSGYLKGVSEMSMGTINKILAVTGLTYEEAFGEVDGKIEEGE